jgi:radial spoke head protein 9
LQRKENKQSLRMLVQKMEVKRLQSRTKVTSQTKRKSKSLQKISLVHLSFIKLLELDRLVYVVLAIENDCSICPVGAYKLTPVHQVRRNESFKGLSKQEFLDLGNYLHFRNVQTAQYKEELDKPSAPFNPRFLEPITED